MHSFVKRAIAALCLCAPMASAQRTAVSVPYNGPSLASVVTWSSSYSGGYAQGQLVTRNQQLCVSLKYANTGDPATDTTDWACSAAPGGASFGSLTGAPGDNTALSAALASKAAANAATTVNGQTCALGGSCTISTGGGGTVTAASSPVGTAVASSVVNTALSTANSLIANFTHTLSNGCNSFPAGGNYPGNFASDGGLTMTQYPSYFSAADVKCLVSTVTAHPNANGDLPFAVVFPSNGDATQAVPHYFDTAWDQFNCVVGDAVECSGNSYGGNHAENDAVDFIPTLELLYYQKSGDLTQFTADRTVLETAMARIPLDSATGLVYINPSAPWINWGFRESIRDTGLDLFASLFYWRSANSLAALYTASGDSSDAARWTAVATKIAGSLNTTSGPLWNSANGMLNAASIQNAQPDVWGSSFCVYLGVCTGTVATNISTFLNANFSTIASHGWAIPTYVPSSGSVNFAYFGNLNSSGGNGVQQYGAGSYQNGRWTVANLWITTALAVNKPEVAASFAAATFDGTYSPTMEWYDNVNGTNTANSNASALNLESPMGSLAYLLNTTGIHPFSLSGTGQTSSGGLSTVTYGSNAASGAYGYFAQSGISVAPYFGSVAGTQAMYGFNAYYNGTAWTAPVAGAPTAWRFGTVATADFVSATSSGGVSLDDCPLQSAGSVTGMDTTCIGVAIGPGIDTNSNPVHHVLLNPQGLGSQGITLTPGTNIGKNTVLAVNPVHTADNNAVTQITTKYAADKAVVLQGTSGQTGDLLEAQDSTGAVHAALTAGGALTVTSCTGCGGSGSSTWQTPTLASQNGSNAGFPVGWPGQDNDFTLSLSNSGSLAPGTAVAQVTTGGVFYNKAGTAIAAGCQVGGVANGALYPIYISAVALPSNKTQLTLSTMPNVTIPASTANLLYIVTCNADHELAQ